MTGWLDRLRRAAPEGDDSARRGAVLGAVALALAERRGLAVEGAGLRLLDGRVGPPLDPALVLPLPEPAGPETVGPDLLGLAAEALLRPDRRRATGAFYTPRPVAEALVAEARRDLLHAPAAVKVADPAVGAGAFLLAAARALAADGADPRAVVERQLWGVDLDEVAVAVTEAALVLWAWDGHGEPPRPGPHLAVADALTDPPPWAEPPTEGFDLVVGNPPFQGQLQRATARTRAAAADLRARHGEAARGYADTAALFLLAATGWVAPGGRVALLQPQSTLATRDAAPIRAAVLAGCSLQAVWLADGPVFAAEVRVCAPVLERGGPRRRRVRLLTGTVPRPAGTVAVDVDALAREPTWGRVAAAARRWPAPALAVAGRLGDECGATAGFRDQFYGLAPAVVEGAADGEGEEPRLVTAGLIDPAVCHWGHRPARFAGRRWAAPALHLERLGRRPDLVRWVENQLVPKVLVATQTRTVEAVVDDDGALVASVPVVAVVPHRPERRWAVAAALSAPPVTAWALGRYGGAALAVDAIKLSARQVLEVPLPADTAGWEEGAALLMAAAAAPDEERWRAALARFGEVMTRAYGVDDGGELCRWWASRLPTWRRTDPRTHGADISLDERPSSGVQ